MTVQTARGVPVSEKTLSNYTRNLVNLIFKILPIRESEEPSLKTYMESLQAELLGCASLIETINADPLFLSLIFALQFLIDHTESDVSVFKREVFKAISICNKLKVRYATESNDEEG